MSAVVTTVDVPTAPLDRTHTRPTQFGAAHSRPARRDINSKTRPSLGRSCSAIVATPPISSHVTHRTKADIARHNSAVSGELIKDSRKTCVSVQGLGRDERLSFYNRQLTSLPCVHDRTTASGHGSGNSAVFRARMLQFSHNNITSFCVNASSLQGEQPVELASFTRVVVLDVSHNGLLSLDGVEAMTSLQVLHASHNKLTNILPLFRPNSALQKSGTLRLLDVSFNCIETLPTAAANIEVAPFCSLRTLTISYNYLKHIEALAGIFPGLLELSVAHNQITEAPSELPKRIRFLNIKYNYLQKAAQSKLRELQRQKHYFVKVELDKQRAAQVNGTNLFNCNDDGENHVSTSVCCVGTSSMQSAEEAFGEDCPVTSKDFANVGKVVPSGAARRRVNGECFAARRMTVDDKLVHPLSAVLSVRGTGWTVQLNPQAMWALVDFFAFYAFWESGSAAGCYYLLPYAGIVVMNVLRFSGDIFVRRSRRPRLNRRGTKNTAEKNEDENCCAGPRGLTCALVISVKPQPATIQQEEKSHSNNNNNNRTNGNNVLNSRSYCRGNNDSNGSNLHDETLKSVENGENNKKDGHQNDKQFYLFEDTNRTNTTKSGRSVKKKRSLKHVLFTREWLIDELRAPLKWTGAHQLYSDRNYYVL